MISIVGLTMRRRPGDMKYAVNAAPASASGNANSIAYMAAFSVPKASGLKLNLGSKESSEADDCQM